MAVWTVRGCVRAATGMLAAIAVVTLAGCLRVSVQTSQQYDWVQGSFIHLKGTGVIQGQAFLQKDNGGVIYAAGRNIVLLPATPYVAERFVKVYGDRKYRNILRPTLVFEETDEGFYNDQRIVKADPRGRFRFDKLAPGRYFVETAIVWQQGDLPAGGRLYDMVEVGKDAVVEVMLSGF